ncbi:MAG: hypothetical protein LBJ20_07810 [Candidatus Methanoplasma sp.]|nr:hypothetical protein [Candidatus Methanoplasma sp.]
MIKKLFRPKTFVLEPNRNKSLPTGTIAFVKEYLRKLGLEDHFNKLKLKGEPLFPLVCAIISYRLTENYSAEGCGRWLSSEEVRNEFGIRKEVSSRTINRAVETVGKRMPEILSKVRDSLFSLYDLEHTDVNIDTTSVSVYSKQSSLFRFGYSRDKRPDLRQVNAGIAELRNPINIPFHMTVSEGNSADPIQFVRMVNDIIGELKENSMFVFDAGGDTKQVLDIISGKGMRYVTRKKMNVSDDKLISNVTSA